MDGRPTGRFAPTPSGRLHLGNLLCAMLAYLSARSQGGRFLLRIEDVDVPRCPRRASEQCVEDLRRLGFTWDGPIVYQSERGEAYAEALARLRAMGRIYPCFCTRAELHSLQAPNQGDGSPVYPGTCRGLTEAERAERRLRRSPSLRVRLPEARVGFRDGQYGWQSADLARDCGDPIVLRSDGLYAYPLAVVVDDAASGVDEIVRGRDILPATPVQLALQAMLGLPAPRYRHIPLLTDADGRRLAKRDRDLDLTALSRRFSPEELLGLLACAAGILEEPEPMDLERLIPRFDWARVRRDDMRLPRSLTDKA